MTSESYLTTSYTEGAEIAQRHKPMIQALIPQRKEV
jgi:hypothetical protein